jgi:DNA-binding NarL/FixJ family response regulator
MLRMEEVLLVEDDPTQLELLAAVIRSALSEVRIRSACTLAEALEQARAAERLDLVTLELGLPGCSGIDALLRFRRDFPTMRVLVVSACEDPACITAALEAGAAGYVPKSLTLLAIAAAIRLVGEGGSYVPPGMPERGKPAPASPRAFRLLRSQRPWAHRAGPRRVAPARTGSEQQTDRSRAEYRRRKRQAGSS